MDRLACVGFDYIDRMLQTFGIQFWSFGEVLAIETTMLIIFKERESLLIFRVKGVGGNGQEGGSEAEEIGREEESIVKEKKLH